MDQFAIDGRAIGSGNAVYVVAELSGNHNRSFDVAVRMIEAAKEAGADAVKLQTYTPDTITLDSRNEPFRIEKNADGDWITLHEIYRNTFTPWEWQPKLARVAKDHGLDLYASPFDPSAVDFLEQMNVPAYKIASFELIDHPLLRHIAAKGKPIMMSTGMASLGEIEEALHVLSSAGCAQILLLKCTSAYPAPLEEMNLRTIPHLREAFELPVGLSDHSRGIAIPVAAVALGACVVEKHFILSRSDGGPESSFALEPSEFKAMVDAVRSAEQAIGRVHYGVTKKEGANRIFRRSLFVVKDIGVGEVFTDRNVRSIRPGHGLHPKELNHVLGRCATRDISRGTPLSWSLVAD
jgi:N-acetylneuraminate synthase